MYLEGLGSASLVDGVLRIATAYRNSKGETVAGEDLIMPASRVAGLSEALQSVVAQLRNPDAAANATPEAGNGEVGEAEDGKKSE